MQVHHKNSSTKLQKEAELLNHKFMTKITHSHLELSTKLILEIKTDKEQFALERNISHSKKFQNLLFEAVDECLSSLGDSAKQAIYFHLEKSFKIKRCEIPNKIEEFTTAIETIFGDGARLLEIQMMKRLHQKIGQGLKHYPKKNDLLFSEYLRAHETI